LVVAAADLVDGPDGVSGARRRGNSLAGDVSDEPPSTVNGHVVFAAHTQDVVVGIGGTLTAQKRVGGRMQLN